MNSIDSDSLGGAQDVPAVWMRGGACKGLFFELRHLPKNQRLRDALLLRVVGGTATGAMQRDGVGGASADTSKVVVVWPSLRDDAEVDFLVGHVAVNERHIDWSRNCDQLSAAVGPFAIAQGLVAASEGITTVHLWQSGLGQAIDAFVPVQKGRVLETGGFTEPEVGPGGSEIRLEFLAAEDAKRPEGLAPGLLPTGAVQEVLEVDGLGPIAVTMVATSEVVVLVKAQSVGLDGREIPADLSRLRKLPAALERLRGMAACRLGLVQHPADAALLMPTQPKLVWVSQPLGYKGSHGESVAADAIDVAVRVMVGGRLEASIPGPVAVSIVAAAAVPGSVIQEITRTLPGVSTRMGHPSGVLTMGASVRESLTGWRLERVVLSHSARRLMSGCVHVPAGWAVESIAGRN